MCLSSVPPVRLPFSRPSPCLPLPPSLPPSPPPSLSSSLPLLLPPSPPPSLSSLLLSPPLSSSLLLSPPPSVSLPTFPWGDSLSSPLLSSPLLSSPLLSSPLLSSPLLSSLSFSHPTSPSLSSWLFTCVNRLSGFISLRHAGSPNRLTLKLPLFVNKFFVPTALTSQDFFSRWKALGG